jgi:hypothetical protein
LTDSTPIRLDAEEINLISLNHEGNKIPVVHIVMSEDSELIEASSANSGTYLVKDVKLLSDGKSIELTFEEDSEEPEETYPEDGVEERLIENPQQYSLIIPLQYVQASQMIGMWLAAPSFVISTGFGNLTIEEINELDIDYYDALIDFPAANSIAFMQFMSTLTKATTGKLLINIDVKFFNEIRSELISVVMDLVNGNPEGLIKVYAYINPLNELNAKQTEEGFEPTKEQEKLYLLRDFVRSLQQKTHPSALAPVFHESEDPAAFTEEIESFEAIMKSNGFTEDSFVSEEPSGSLDKVNYNSSPEQKIAFLSAPLTPDILPNKMTGLKDKIIMPALYETNWNNVDPEDAEKITDGDIVALTIILIATRLSRLEQLDDPDHRHLSPMLVLVEGLSNQNEQILWAISESIKLLAKDNALPFTDLFECTVPDINEPRTALQAPLGMLLHQFGHLVLKEEWSKDIIMIALKDYPVIMSFVEDLFPNEYDSDDDEDEHNNSQPCIPAQAAINLLSIGFTVPDIISQLGQSMVSLAELNAFKHTNFSKGSSDWNEYTDDYLSKIVSEED